MSFVFIAPQRMSEVPTLPYTAWRELTVSCPLAGALRSDRKMVSYDIKMRRRFLFQ